MALVANNFIDLFVNVLHDLWALAFIESFTVLFVLVHENDVFEISAMVEFTIFLWFQKNRRVF